MSHAPLVICCGSAVVDHVFDVAVIPESAMKVPASRYRESGGGIAATAAVAVAALGGKAIFWGVLGEDHAGSVVREMLHAAGVDAADVIQDGLAQTPVSGVLVDDAGERLLAFFPGHRPSGLEKTLPLERVKDAGAVLADIRWFDGAIAALNAARSSGVQTVLDIDVSKDPRLPELIGLADHAIFSMGGLHHVTGAEVPEEGLSRAATITGGIVGVTLGQDGYLWLEEGRVHREPAFAVAVKDTNGAGDTFHGAYALAIAERRSAAEAARFANAAAAAKCVRTGGWSGMPLREDAEILLAGRIQ
ncbi:PfkB family carbohydrate kinase [Mesorhizobium sp. 10J20-29]